jgi:hypothetical protein
MTLLNTANKLFFGATAVDRVYLGAQLVWEPPVTGPTASLLQSFTPGTDRNDFTGEVGVRLGIGAAPIPVSWVGIRHNGYGGTRTVKLYEWFSGAVQRSVNIDLTGGVPGEYVWAPIPPITLGAGGYYALLMVCTASDGQWWRNPGPVTFAPSIVNVYDSYYAGGLDLGW